MGTGTQREQREGETCKGSGNALAETPTEEKEIDHLAIVWRTGELKQSRKPKTGKLQPAEGGGVGDFRNGNIWGKGTDSRPFPSYSQVLQGFLL